MEDEQILVCYFFVQTLAGVDDKDRQVPIGFLSFGPFNKLREGAFHFRVEVD